MRAGAHNGAPATMSAPALRRTLLWLLAIRAGAVTLLLGAGSLTAISAPGRGPFFFLIGLTYALTIVYVLTLRRAERQPWLLDLQFAADAIIVSGIVASTGGVQSNFSPLYALPIIAASSVRSRAGGISTAVLSAALYISVVALQYSVPSFLRILTPDVVLPPWRIALLTIGVNVFGFAGVAMLAGELAERLRVAGQELARTSSELAELQAFNAYVIDSLTSGLATADEQGRLISFNPAAEQITGIPTPRAIGRSARDVLQLPEAFADAMDAGGTGPRRCEFAYVREDRRQIEIGLSSTPLLTPQGQAGRLLTFQDVTEQRRRDRDARIQQRLAAVGEMAAGIAHEIRNPLASMSGSIQVLRQDLPLNAEQEQLMDIVLRESERLNETIKSFLAYTRPQRATLQKLDLRQALHDTAALLRNSAELKDAHRVAVDVPSEPVMLEADEAQVKQIVWNLATNGLRAMPEGGRLRLAASSNGHGAVIAVQDEGVGIPREELDGIFQPFRGAFFKGSGLGLSIVHRIVSDYGGEIQVTSERGQGTTVTVQLPVVGSRLPVDQGA
ncbi:MAG TPA: ATP-binding protein [Vicinamibacterales bacterium]|nr:ATP-binding protein [Vicinamibacterales bacterium]